MLKHKKYLVLLICLICLGVSTLGISLCAVGTADARTPQSVWQGSRNIYGGEESRIELPLTLNGNTVQAFYMDGNRLSMSYGEYSVSDDKVTVEPKITTRLGRGGYPCEIRVSDNNVYKFVLYVGVEKNEGILLDFDVNVYENKSDLFVPSKIEEGQNGKYLHFDGNGGTLFGYDKNGSFGFYRFDLKPYTEYLLQYDFRFGPKSKDWWITIVRLDYIVFTMQPDGTVTIQDNADGTTRYRITENEDGSERFSIHFTTHGADACTGLYFGSDVGVDVDLKIDNILLMPYSEKPLKGAAPAISKVGTECVETDADYSAGEDLRKSLRLRAEIENAPEKFEKLGFEVTLPNGDVRTFTVGGADENGQYALDLLDVTAGRYEVRAFFEADWCGDKLSEKSSAVITDIDVPEQEEETAEIYIIAGQSNAYGSTAAKTMHIKNAWENNANMFFPASFGGVVSSQSDVEFLPITENNANFENAGAIGPEVGFSNQLCKADGGKKIYIIKQAQGGSELHDRWASPSSGNTVTPGKSPLYSWLMGNCERAAAYFKAKNIRPRIKGFLWMQGESDAGTQEIADTYERNLNIFIDDVLSDLSEIWETDLTGLPFIIGGIQTTKNMPYAQTVIAAQKKVSSERANCHYVSTEDLPLYDNWHFTGNAAYELGARFAREIMSVYGIDGDYTFNTAPEQFSVRKYYSRSLTAVAASDKTTLKNYLINNVYNESDYTKNSYRGYSEARRYAEDLLTADDVTQSDIDAALSWLLQAEKRLTACYSKQKLSDALNKAKELVGQGTARNKARLEFAIKQTETLLECDEISSELGKIAYGELSEAIAAVQDDIK